MAADIRTFPGRLLMIVVENNIDVEYIYSIVKNK